MSTLNVTSIQNPAAPQANLSLNADGTVTLPVFTGAAAPPLFQAGTLWFDTAGPSLLVRNPGNTAWIATSSGGGGSVTGVTATAPLVSSGGAAPNLTITPATSGAAGSMSAADKAKLDGAATIVSAVTGTAPITVATGTSTPLIAINAATTALPGSIQLATAAENAAGTDATKAVTPAFSVPKDAANMTGAALLPAGTDIQRAAIATPVVGMQRYKTTSGFEEIYTGATSGWKQLQYVPTVSPAPADLIITANTTLNQGSYLVNNLVINAGVTVTVTSGQGLKFDCLGTATINGTINLDFNGPAGGTPFQTNPLIPGVFPERGAGLGGGGGNAGGTPYPAFVSPTGSGGSSGYGSTVAGGTTDAVTGGGGRAGGSIYIGARGAITLGATGALSANGGNGIPTSAVGGSSFQVGGGGGGSGGVIILNSLTSLNCAGTISANGGAGSAGVATGIYTGANGGGGGGGGIIILQTNGTLTDTSTKTVTAGANGATSGAVGIGGAGGGGGCGGRGSNGGSDTASAGQILYYGAP